MTSLQRRLQKLELRSLAYGLAAQPDGESKRFVIARRLQRLEEGFGLGPGTEQLLLVVTAAGKRLALNQDRCIQILRECGLLPTGPVGVVNLGQIPDGLNAEELETFLREDGADICGLRSAQNEDDDHQADS